MGGPAGGEWPGSLEDRTGALGGLSKAEGTRRGELADLERSQRPWGEILAFCLKAGEIHRKGLSGREKVRISVLEGPFRSEVYAAPSAGSGLKKLGWVCAMALSAGVTEKKGHLCSPRWKWPQNNTLNGNNQGTGWHSK